MPGEHYLEFLNFATGARLGISTGATGNVPTGSTDVFANGFRRLTVRKVVDTPGSIDIELPSTHPLLQFADKTIVVDWRRDVAAGIDWYRHLVGFIRDPSYFSNKGNKYVTVSAIGIKGILSWYIVAWAAGVANRTVFTATAAETIMKTLVARNAVTATATAAAGRDRNCADYGISSEADSARGNVFDWTASRTHTLLEELQAIALIAGGDFDLNYLTATTRQFVWVPFVSKTATIIFSEILGNMDNIKFQRIRSIETTVAIVGGQGDLSERDIVIRTGPNFSASNDIETFINATDITKGATAQLQARGDSKLQDSQARDNFSFDIIQIDSCRYKRDYIEGDFVSAIRPDNVKVTVQVWGTTIDWKPNEAEHIAIEVRTR